MTVELYNNIDLRKISIKKKIASYANSYKHFIKYNREYPLLLQTPTLTLTFGITQSGLNKYIDVSIFEHATELVDFKDKIERINTHILRRFNYECRNKTYINSLKKSDKYGDRFRFFLSDYIIYFDDDKKRINADSIKAKTHVKLIISPVYVWYTEEIYGIRWEVIQLKRYSIVPNLSEYAFIEPRPTMPPPEYLPYFDLVKRGVPKQAVKNKLISLNMDPTVLDLSVINTSSIGITSISSISISSPSISSISINTLPHHSNLKNNLLKQICGGNFKLNKNKRSPPKTKSIYEAPSLDEIRLKLTNLRKI